MNINPEDYVSTPNNWFKTEIEYQGLGIARFENPSGYIQGVTTAQFDETGNAIITMKIDKFECEDYLETKFSQDDTLKWLINGRKPKIQGMYAIHGIGVKPLSVCISLEIITSNGVFRAIDKIHHSQLQSVDKLIDFYVSSSEYVSQKDQDAVYWVIPLTNFISQDLITIHRPLQRHILDQHPLRIYPTPVVPLDLPHDEQLSALSHANHSNCLIMFEIEGKLGFIERLSDYFQRAEKLANNQSHLLITSIMVGQCTGKPLQYDLVFDWLPFSFLHMLSLASGSFVGTPWVEFRDASGRLVRRIHSRQWEVPYGKGHIAIDNFSGGGVGWLLSKAPSRISPELRTAIILTVKAGQKDYYLEDALVFLFRAADTITSNLRTKILPKEKVQLKDGRENEIKNIIDQARKAIQEIKKRATDEEKIEIEKIIQRISGAMNQSPKNPDEGEALKLLIQESSLKDFEVIPEHNKWVQVYNKYRNQVIHESYLTKEYPLNEAIPLFFYVHDVLIRILLTKLNYDGQYRKAIPLKENRSVNWVELTTSYKELWYEEF